MGYWKVIEFGLQMAYLMEYFTVKYSEYLMGFDGYWVRLALYISEEVVVRVTSLAYDYNGMNVAVGTRGGCVALYDMNMVCLYILYNFIKEMIWY